MRGVDQPCLQIARGHAGGRERAVGQTVCPLAQGIGRALGQNLAPVHDEDLRAALGLVHVGGADDHAQPLVVDQLLHDAPEIAARERVDANAGFVQQQQVGGADQRAGEAQFLLHAARELACGPVGKARHVGHFEHAGEAVAARVHRHAVQVGVEVEVFLHAQVFVETEALGHVADPVLHLLGVAGDVDAQHAERAAIRCHQPGEHAHQGRLASAVRPDQRGQFALAHREREPVDRRDRAGVGIVKAFPDLPRLDRRGGHDTGSTGRRTVTGWPSRRESSASSTMMRTS